MLRFVTLFFVRLSILVAGAGLLVSHAWGWSEYASPELYVVYFQISQRKIDYFIVNADGSSPGQRLIWGDGGIANVDCSPDGRTFAFLSADQHAYVTTSTGVVHDTPADPRYTTVNVANDGTLALFDPTDTRLLVNDREFDLAAAGQTGSAFDHIDISAQGLVLWMQDFPSIQVVSLATGSVIPTVSHGYSGQWNTSGEMFVFADQVTNSDGVGIYGGQFLMDLASQRVMRIGDWTLSRPLSPDSTKVAAAVPITSLNHIAQIAISSVFQDRQRILLTHDDKTPSMPVCFLTFRPNLLINGS
jgi:hypothetical protein